MNLEEAKKVAREYLKDKDVHDLADQDWWDAISPDWDLNVWRGNQNRVMYTLYPVVNGETNTSVFYGFHRVKRSKRV